MKAIIIFFIVAPMFSIQSYGQNKYYEKAIAWEPWVQVAGRVNFDTDTSMTLVGGSFASLTSPERVNMVFCDQYAENRTVLTYGEGFGKFVELDTTPTPFGYSIVGWMTDTANLTYAYPYLLELDQDGEVLQLHQFDIGTYEGDACKVLYYPKSNTYYIGGEVFNALPSKRMLIKVSDGVVQWQQYYPATQGRNIILDLLPTPTGQGVYAAGYYKNDPDNNYGDPFLMEIDSSGTVLWDSVYVSSGQDACFKFTRTPAGGFLLGGPVRNTDYTIQARLLCTDSVGGVLWLKKYFQNYQYSGIMKIYTAGNDFVFAGSVKINDDFEGYLMKVRGSDGYPLWTRFYEMGDFNDFFYHFTPAPDGGFVCVGRAEFADTVRAYVVRTNCMGLLTLPESAFSYQTLSDGNDVAFLNQSQYAYPDSIDGGYYVWDFGDGSPPSVCGQGYPPNISHSYPSAGQYNVRLWAIVCGDTSLSSVVVVPGSGGSGQSVGLQPAVEALPSRLQVNPNPARDLLQLSLLGNLTPQTQAGGCGRCA
ncbi:MAG: PKD domain-containing protein [Sphingobacteriales bacterium]|nr:PKD domain-containing protein [Sphingobacteriales bacterium]